MDRLINWLLAIALCMVIVTCAILLLDFARGM